MTTAANRAVVWMDRHAKLWLGLLTVVVLGLVVLGVSTAIYTAHTAAKQSKQEAIQEAAIRDEYTRCVNSIPLLSKFREHVHGVNDLARILVKNSEASIAAAPKNDPLAATRRANLERTRHAARRIAAVQTFPVPTVASCELLRVNAERRAHGQPLLRVR